MEKHKQNFLSYHKPAPKKKLSLGSFFLIALKVLEYLLIVLVIIFLICAILAVVYIRPYYQTVQLAYEQGLAGQAFLQNSENLLLEQKFQEAVDQLAEAENSFKKSGEALDLVGKAGLLKASFINDQYKTAKDIISIGEITAGALKRITEKGIEIKTLLNTDKIVWQDITPEQKGEILQVLAESVEDLKVTQQDLDLVSEKMIEINSQHPLFVFDRAIVPLQTKLPKIKKTFNSLITVAELLPAFSGYPEEKTYLFILQNNREMRPSGGFIGTYGILKIKNAEVVSFFTDNSYNLDKLMIGKLEVEPPLPIEKYMAQDHWYFRDSNWWPDFPTSAEKAMWFYHAEGGTEKLDGVIAVTPTVLESMMAVLGNFTVQDLLFKQDNFWEQLQYQVEFGYYNQGIEESDRKDIIGELGEQILQRMYTLPMNQFNDLVEIVTEQVEEKQIQVYFTDVELENLALQNNWAGQVKGYAGDYIMLVDANLAALKTDSVMERTLQYALSVDENKNLIATVSVNYQNLGTFSWKTTRYRTYTRLYTPLGSELIKLKVGDLEVKSEDIDTYEEFSKTAFGTFFQIEPQSSKTVTWQYKLPQQIRDYVDAGIYNLMVQKQAGIPKLNLQLDLSFDKDLKLRKSTLGESNKLKYVEVLRKDRIYSVWFD